MFVAIRKSGNLRFYDCVDMAAFFTYIKKKNENLSNKQYQRDRERGPGEGDTTNLDFSFYKNHIK